jgi:hypothetical protein
MCDEGTDRKRSESTRKSSNLVFNYNRDATIFRIVRTFRNRLGITVADR